MGATPAPRGTPEDSSAYVERWWHLLGISFTAALVSMRQGQAIFRQPKLLAWGLVASTLSWIAQLIGIYWTIEGLLAAGRSRRGRRRLPRVEPRPAVPDHPG